MTSTFLTNVEIHPSSKFTKGRSRPKPAPGVITKTLLSCAKVLPADQIQLSTRLKNQSFVLFSPTHPTNQWFPELAHQGKSRYWHSVSLRKLFNREDISWECLVRSHFLLKEGNFLLVRSHFLLKWLFQWQSHFRRSQQPKSLPLSVQKFWKKLDW